MNYKRIGQRGEERRILWPYFLTLIIGLLLGAIIIGKIYKENLIAKALKEYKQITGRVSSFDNKEEKAEPVQAQQANLQQEVCDSRKNAIVMATKMVSPAVVSLSVLQVRKVRPSHSFFDDPFFNQFLFGFGGAYQQVQSMGSGFIIDKRGYVLTNYHVVESATKIIVTLPDQRQFEGKVMGSIRSSDLAIIKISGTNLPTVRLGNSDDLMIGEWAIAIGNPFGNVLDDAHPTVTVGVISAIDRRVKGASGLVYNDMIQTDASINMGNSGGPLLNCKGEIIGINTVILSQTGGSIGLGFAIPINRAKKVVNDIVKYGKVRSFWTGISIQNLNKLVAQYLGLKITNGAIIVNVESRSPGEIAGLKIGDVILEVNSRRVDDRRDVQEIFYGAQVGEVFAIKYYRNEKIYLTKLKLLEDPNQR